MAKGEKRKDRKYERNGMKEVEEWYERKVEKECDERKAEKVCDETLKTCQFHFRSDGRERWPLLRYCH